MLVTWELEDRHRCRYSGKQRRNIITIDARRILIPKYSASGARRWNYLFFSLQILILFAPGTASTTTSTIHFVRACELTAAYILNLQRGPGPLLVLHNNNNNNNTQNPKRAARGQSRYLPYSWRATQKPSLQLFSPLSFSVSLSIPFYEARFCCAGSDR